jgi:hypothetical protein
MFSLIYFVLVGTLLILFERRNRLSGVLVVNYKPLWGRNHGY